VKLKKAKIVIKDIDTVKKDWKLALSGKLKSQQKGDQIIFTSIEAVAKIFSKSRLEILKVVAHEKPHSLYELAKILNRDFKNVHADVKILVAIGLIQLRSNNKARRGLAPTSLYSGIELDWAA
jgi:predicted transcriptional regulator